MQEGPFTIQNCGTNTETIQNLIRLFPTILDPAIEDAARHVASDAYMAFFKDINYASQVREVLQKVSTGAPIPLNTKGASPWIYCITGPNQVIEVTGWDNHESDFYLDSLADGRLAHTDWGNYDDSEYVFLYPGFWKLPSIPSASPSRCLTLLPHFNKYKPGDQAYVRYQFWVLMHELAHQYPPDSFQDLYGEVMSVNACIQLPASEAIRNAQNYVYYVASKY